MTMLEEKNPIKSQQVGGGTEENPPPPPPNRMYCTAWELSGQKHTIHKVTLLVSADKSFQPACCMMERANIKWQRRARGCKAQWLGYIAFCAVPLEPGGLGAVWL